MNRMIFVWILAMVLILSLTSTRIGTQYAEAKHHHHHSYAYYYGGGGGGGGGY